jgi:hypothetical protein
VAFGREVGEGELLILQVSGGSGDEVPRIQRVGGVQYVDGNDRMGWIVRTFGA